MRAISSIRSSSISMSKRKDGGVTLKPFRSLFEMQARGRATSRLNPCLGQRDAQHPRGTGTAQSDRTALRQMAGGQQLRSTGPGLPPQVSTISCVARSMALRCKSKSTPRS
jgi:hypothetical protein